MWNAGLNEAPAGIKIAERNIDNLRYADDTTFTTESEELKSLLLKVKEESEKVGLQLNVQKTKIMASSPITSWEIDRETVSDVILGAPKTMAPHSSTLAWEIPWTEEPGRLQSMRLRRVRHDWATSLSLFTFMHRRKKWQPTPVFLPGESQGREPGGLPSMESHRVGHDWHDLAAALWIRAKSLMSGMLTTIIPTPLSYSSCLDNCNSSLES